MAARLKALWRERVIDPIKVLPRCDILRALILGTYAGVFPIPGVTSGVLTILILLCKLSGMTLSVSLCAFSLTVNILLTPIELALIPMQSNLGARLLEPALVCPWTDIHALSWTEAFNDFSKCIAGAILVWSSFFPIVALGVIYASVLTTPSYGRTSSSEAKLTDSDADLWTASLLPAPNAVDPMRPDSMSPERGRQRVSSSD